MGPFSIIDCEPTYTAKGIRDSKQSRKLTTYGEIFYAGVIERVWHAVVWLRRAWQTPMWQSERYESTRVSIDESR